MSNLLSNKIHQWFQRFLNNKIWTNGLKAKKSEYTCWGIPRNLANINPDSDTQHTSKNRTTEWKKAQKKVNLLSKVFLTTVKWNQNDNTDRNSVVVRLNTSLLRSVVATYQQIKYTQQMKCLFCRLTTYWSFVRKVADAFQLSEGQEKQSGWFHYTQCQPSLIKKNLNNNWKFIGIRLFGIFCSSTLKYIEYVTFNKTATYI